MPINKRAVGVFDSGLGGLTAVKQLKNVLPNENIIYFGDTARVPYGTHSFETIIKYANDDMRFLLDFDIKAVLVACGTVSAIALDTLKEKFPLPMTGVVSPAAIAAAKISKSGKIAVLGTPAAVKNGAYEREIQKLLPNASVFPVACPLFVPLVENGYVEEKSEVTYIVAREYLSKLENTDIDVIILGCTHYPIIKDIIAKTARELFKREIAIVDSGSEAALYTRTLLYENGLLNSSDNKGEIKFFVSDETQDFKCVASRFMGENVTYVQKVDLEFCH